VLDGAYLVGTEPPVFRRIEPPRQEELQALVEQMAERIGRALERQGILARDAESSHLELDAGGPLDDLLGHSITYRVAVGPRVGQKVFSLQTVPAREDGPSKGVAQYAGFSLHAGIGVEAEQRGKLERLTRYVSRPPVAEERLDLTTQGRVRYRLKTPYRDGTTHIVLEPLDFIARLGVERRAHELGETSKARLRHRDRAVRRVRWAAEGDCEYRGAVAHRADSRAPT
jgi:hypothetical protein